MFVWIATFVQEVLLDIKDIEEDQKSNLLTLPIILNRKLLFLILAFFSVLAIVPIVYGINSNQLPPHAAFLIITLPYNLVILKYTKEIYKNPKYINILIDGEKILWSILIFGFYNFL